MPLPLTARFTALNVLLAGMLLTGRPIRLYNELRRLGRRVAQLPGIDLVTPKSAAAATLAGTIAAAGYLIWAIGFGAVVDACTRVDPADRPSAAQVAALCGRPDSRGRAIGRRSRPR